MTTARNSAIIEPQQHATVRQSKPQKEVKLSTTECKRLIEWLEKHGYNDAEIKEAIYYIASGVDRTAETAEKDN